MAWSSNRGDSHCRYFRNGHRGRARNQRRPNFPTDRPGNEFKLPSRVRGSSSEKKEAPRILPSVAALTSLGLCRLFRLGNGIAKDTTELTFSGRRAAIVPVIGPPSLSAATPVYVETRSDVSPALRVSWSALTWHRRGTRLLSVAAVVKPPSRVFRKLSIRTRAEIPSSRVSGRNRETVL